MLNDEWQVILVTNVVQCNLILWWAWATHTVYIYTHQIVLSPGPGLCCNVRSSDTCGMWYNSSYSGPDNCVTHSRSRLSYHISHNVIILPLRLLAPRSYFCFVVHNSLTPCAAGSRAGLTVTLMLFYRFKQKLYIWQHFITLTEYEWGPDCWTNHVILISALLMTGRKTFDKIVSLP